MFFSEGLNRPLGLCAQAKERPSVAGMLLRLIVCSHSKARSPADVWGPPQSHFVFSHSRKFTNLTKNTKSHLKGKCSVPQHGTTEFRLFTKWQTPKKEEGSNLWTGCWEGCIWVCWWEGQSVLDIGIFSRLQNTAKNRSSHSCSDQTKVRSYQDKKRMHFSHPEL